MQRRKGESRQWRKRVRVGSEGEGENNEQEHNRLPTPPPMDGSFGNRNDSLDIVSRALAEGLAFTPAAETEEPPQPIVSESEDEETEDVMYEPTILLYPNASKTRDSFLVEWVSDCIRHSISDAAAEELFQTVRSALPLNNTLPRTYATAKKTVERMGTDDIVLSHTTICKEGHLPDDCSCLNPVVSSVTKFDVAKQIRQLQLKYAKEIEDYGEETANTTDHVDCAQGKLFRSAMSKGLTPVSLYTDGGRYAISGLSECGVVLFTLLALPPKLRHAYGNAIFVGLWYGIPKPDWNAFFNYVDLNRWSRALEIVQVIADIPARQSLLNMKNVPAYSCCFYCDIIGIKCGQNPVTYPHEAVRTSMMRKEEHFLAGTFGGMKGLSVLSGYVKLPWAITIDSMHSSWAGCIRDDVRRVFNGYKKGEIRVPSLTTSFCSRLDALIERNRPSWPSEFVRKLRKTKNNGYWKATEWKLFVIFGLPSFMFTTLKEAAKECRNQSVAKMRMQQAFSLLRISAALRILVQQRISDTELQKAETLIENWRKERTDLSQAP